MIQHVYDSPRKKVSFELCTPQLSGIVSNIPYPTSSRAIDRKAAVVYYNSKIDDNSLHSLYGSPADIKKISLRGCGLLSYDAVTSIFHLYPNLIHLDLTGATKLKDSLICIRRVSLSNLKYIDLSETLMLTDRLLDHLAHQCHQLAIVKLSGYPWPNELPNIGVGLLNLMSETAQTLLHLECRWTRLTSPSGSFPVILDHLARLRYLDLHGCAIDDGFVGALSGATGKLEHLDVGECHGITSASVLADLIWSNQSTLKLLDISRSTTAPKSKTIILDFDIMAAIWSCPHLGTLRMSDSVVYSGAEDFWERTFYSIPSSPEVNCRLSMTELDLRNAHELDDSGILLLPRTLSNLRVLDISGATLSEAAFESFMVQLAGHPLETLRMRGVLKEPSHEAEFGLNESLRCLDFADDNVSEAVILNLIRFLPNLSEFHFGSTDPESHLLPINLHSLLTLLTKSNPYLTRVYLYHLQLLPTSKPPLLSFLQTCGPYLTHLTIHFPLDSKTARVIPESCQNLDWLDVYGVPERMLVEISRCLPDTNVWLGGGRIARRGFSDSKGTRVVREGVCVEMREMDIGDE